MKVKDVIEFLQNKVEDKDLEVCLVMRVNKVNYDFLVDDIAVQKSYRKENGYEKAVEQRVVMVSEAYFDELEN